MDNTLRLEGREMKREVLILNAICVLLALAFVGFVVYNALTADSFSSFLSIDNLFITAFCLMMALIFISIPASWMVTTGVVKIPFMSASPDAAASKAALPAGARTSAAAIGPGNAAATNAAALPARREIQKDAKGRPIPADVQSMVAEMNKSEQKTS